MTGDIKTTRTPYAVGQAVKVPWGLHLADGVIEQVYPGYDGRERLVVRVGDDTIAIAAQDITEALPEWLHNLIQAACLAMEEGPSCNGNHSDADGCGHCAWEAVLHAVPRDILSGSNRRAVIAAISETPAGSR